MRSFLLNFTICLVFQFTFKFLLRNIIKKVVLVNFFLEIERETWALIASYSQISFYNVEQYMTLTFPKKEKTKKFVFSTKFLYSSLKEPIKDVICIKI